MKPIRHIQNSQHLSWLATPASYVDRTLLRLLRPYRTRAFLRALQSAKLSEAAKIRQIFIDFPRLVNDEMDKVAAIESERNGLLACKELLTNITLVPAPLYDIGITVSDACKSSKPPKAALLLYFFVRTFRPNVTIELGANLGISSAYIATAIQLNSNDGQLTTFDASPGRLEITKQLHKSLGLTNVDYLEGLFCHTLDAFLEHSDQVDFAFIDGHHERDPTLEYFEKIAARAADGALFIFDDIRWSVGMNRAWNDLVKDPRFSMTIDLGSMGVGVYRESMKATPPLISKYPAWRV